MTTIAQRLAQHIVTPHELDAELATQVDTFIFDYLAVTIAGAEYPSAESARRASALSETPDALRSSRVLGRELWGTLEEAALVNGVAAHSPELDDTHEQGSMHPGVAIMPAVFAYADARAAAGDPVDTAAIRRAITVGYDAMTSVGVMLGAAESYARGFHPTGVCGSIGAAAAIAALMGLDETQATHAVSLAANMSAGSLEFLSDGSWTKRLNAGHAAATGLRAARLAGAGFEGPAQAFEGRDGFLRLYGEGVIEGREFVLEFGRGVRDTSIKMYPCCRYMHGNIDLLRELHAELPDLTLDEVEVIECGVINAGATLVSVPAERKLIVESSVDAQFNMPFGAAVALTTGTATLDQFDDAVAIASDLHDWIEKVSCYESPRLEAAFPESWQAEVRVRLTDGRVFERYTEAYLGSPRNRASADEITAKAASLVSEPWAHERRERLSALSDGTAFSTSAVI